MSDDAPGLFDVPELVPLPNARRAEAGLTAALREAAAARIIGPTDAGLVAAALVAARALDGAESIRDPRTARMPSRRSCRRSSGRSTASASPPR